MEEEIIENPSTLCRICLNAGNYELSASMTIENEKVVVEEMLKEFSSVQGSDSIPSMLCSNCVTELSECYTFLKKVQRADEYIRQLFDPPLQEQEDLHNRCFSPQEKLSADARNIVSDASEMICDEIEELDFISPILRGEDPPIMGSSSRNQINPGQMDKQERQRAQKRSVHSGKKPVILLTENVSNLLTRVRKSSVDELIEDLTDEIPLEGEPPSKKQRPVHSSFVVTKFVLQPFSGGDSSTTDYDGNRDTNGDGENPENSGIGVNRIQTIDMAAVEIDANAKISAEEIDDDTNFEDPSRIYMCKHCPKAFSTSHHLLMHSRKSHICHFCTQSFAKVEDLHRHSREAHTSFKCSLCEKEFSSNSNLRQHIKRVHKIDLPAFVSLLSVKRDDGLS